MIFLLLACTSGGDTAVALDCTELMASEGTVEEHLEGVQRHLYPSLDGVPVELHRDLTSDQDFFTAAPDLTTLDERPRTYRVRTNVAIDTLGVPVEGIVAILAHELKHVLDYTEMTDVEVVDFGLWYGQGDIAEYERATDLGSLERGCGEGLIAYRDWLYSVVDADTLDAKKRDYMTPDEIRAWMENR